MEALHPAVQATAYLVAKLQLLDRTAVGVLCAASLPWFVMAPDLHSALREEIIYLVLDRFVLGDRSPGGVYGMRKILILVLIALVQLSAQSFALSSESGAGTAVPNTKTPMPAPTGDAEYVIGAEDVLQINVWKETDISGSVPVRPDGKISLPLLNDVQAAGLSPVQLASEISQRLKQFITEPHVTVIVTAMNSRRAYVMGQVTRQGVVPLVSNLTVLQALSSAGGPVQFANTKKIYILRTEGGELKRLPFNYDAVIRGKNPEQNINLKPGDTIVVP